MQVEYLIDFCTNCINQQKIYYINDKATQCNRWKK